MYKTWSTRIATWAATVLLFKGLLVLPAKAADERPPNIVVIMADDMGYADTSVLEGWINTPQLDRMAAEGMYFTDFHSNGAVCSPTRAAFMTGRYQQRAGIGGVINADPSVGSHRQGLDPSEVTFSRLLKDHGYATALFGKWHLGYAETFHPLHHGFDEFRGFISGNVDYISHYDRMGKFDWWNGAREIDDEGYVTHLLTDYSTDFIRRHRDRPFCLYVAHAAPHFPYQAPDDKPERGPEATKPSSQRSQKDTYEIMIQEMDKGIGEILDTLQELGIDENTLVFFFSDNGGAKPWANHPLKGGKGQITEGGHRVPAVAWWPGKIEPGQRSDEIVVGFDLMPTMLDLANVAVPEGHSLDGISLTPHLLRGEALPLRQIFWGRGGVAMREGSWKLIQRGQIQLYNLDDDLGEANNIASEHPERVVSMQAAIAEWREDVARDRGRRTSSGSN